MSGTFFIFVLGLNFQNIVFPFPNYQVLMHLRMWTCGQF